jgi:SAM-dependent methyltransferase
VSGRGQSIYDWWSRHENLFDRLYDVGFLGRETELRERAVESLDLGSGERVLELGCGPGNSFDTLRTRVGSRGIIVGVITLTEWWSAPLNAFGRQAGRTFIQYVVIQVAPASMTRRSTLSMPR